MNNANLPALRIASGVVAAAALIFGIIPAGETSMSNPCGSVFFKSKYAEFCESQYPVNAGLLLVVLLLAAGVCIHATVTMNEPPAEPSDQHDGQTA